MNQIDKDTVAWKYQTGATELSFSGYYQETLQTWDKNGLRKPNYTQEDSLYFNSSTKISAKDYIIQQSKNAQIVIINEAHHIAKHRTFTKSLLKELYQNGYRYLGLEALFNSTYNQSKFPVQEMGYYTKEPEFGNLISEALTIGFTLFNYEASQGKNGKEREIEQAENIQKFIQNNPKGKVLIHCGYAHAFENDYPSWGKAMAGRLKENLKTDPFTIDQTMFLEKSDASFNHLFINLNNTNEPILLKDKDGQIFNGKSQTKQTDVVVVHPPTKYVNNRPDWLIRNKIKHTIPADKIKDNQPSLVVAYRNNEFDNNGIPADVIEITDKKSPRELFLTKGTYTILIINQDYQLDNKYSVKIK
ncbi:MAG: hypothetical protein EOP00_24885 [Pedobacter sp.]|nr:MAG: hypothetical protein EOP00_24885 [Pedobacter sp.]